METQAGAAPEAGRRPGPARSCEGDGSLCPGAEAAAGGSRAGLFRAGRNVLPPVWARLRQRQAGARRGRQRRAEAAESSSPAGPAAERQGAPGQPSAVSVRTGQEQSPEQRQEPAIAAARRAQGRSSRSSPRLWHTPKTRGPAPSTPWSPAARGAAGSS
ncbi:unnamed protein product [Coccothraustes coccothraustes]